MAEVIFLFRAESARTGSGQIRLSRAVYVTLRTLRALVAMVSRQLETTNGGGRPQNLCTEQGLPKQDQSRFQSSSYCLDVEAWKGMTATRAGYLFFLAEVSQAGRYMQIRWSSKIESRVNVRFTQFLKALRPRAIGEIQQHGHWCGLYIKNVSFFPGGPVNCSKPNQRGQGAMSSSDAVHNADLFRNAISSRKLPSKWP